MKRLLAFVSIFSLLSCATGPSKEQQLVSKAVDALGGAQALADVRTIAYKATLKARNAKGGAKPVTVRFSIVR